MAIIGYIRVSTIDQNSDLQRNALTSANCDRIFEDRMSGKVASRPGLKRALKCINSGTPGRVETGQAGAQRKEPDRPDIGVT